MDGEYRTYIGEELCDLFKIDGFVLNPTALGCISLCLSILKIKNEKKDSRFMKRKIRQQRIWQQRQRQTGTQWEAETVTMCMCVCLCANVLQRRGMGWNRYDEEEKRSCAGAVMVCPTSDRALHNALQIALPVALWLQIAATARDLKTTEIQAVGYIMSKQK